MKTQKGKKPKECKPKPVQVTATTGVPECPTGYIWDEEQQKCILDIGSNG
jgi:hypothetical protein